MNLTGNYQKCTNMNKEHSHHEHPCLFGFSQKRQSIIDRGKSWAKQLIKINKPSISTSTPTSTKATYDHFDSGIDTNPSSCSSSTTTSITNYASPNSSNLSTSSSSSFSIENPPSLPNSNSNQSESNNSSCILSNSTENYDQVYFLPSSSNSSSSKTGSSAYLISPLDESGYLVPINNINSSQLSKEKSTEIAFRLNKNLKNNKNNHHHLTRSFSTRSAFSGTQFQSSKDLKTNRATICEQITNNNNDEEQASDNHCLKCNSKLNKQEKEYDSSLLKNNQNQSIFKSFTCSDCLSNLSQNITVLQPLSPPSPFYSTKNSLSTSNTNILTNIPTNPPPPLPLLPPPSLQFQHQHIQQEDPKIQANYVILNQDIDRKQKQQTADVNEKLTKLFKSINTNRNNHSIENKLKNEKSLTDFNRPFKITPLLICTNENNKINITKNNCNCNFCLLNLAYLNKNCSSHLESSKLNILNLTNKLNELNLIDYIDLNTRKPSDCSIISNTNRRNSFICTTDQEFNLIHHRSSTPQLTLEKEPEIKSKCSVDEPIIYIDSVELDEHLNKTTNNNLDNSNMNSFITKLKSKHRLSTIFAEKNQGDTTNSSNNKTTGNHDYHVIDENIEEKITNTAKVKLSPSNSVQSFEFIDHTQQQNVVKCQLDEGIKSYEKSWENQASFLMEKLDKCLKQEQQQHLENKVKIIENNKNCTSFSTQTVALSPFFLNTKPTLIPIKSITPIKLNCSLREKKLNALRNLNSGNLNRKSFHGQACLNEMSNGNLIVNTHHQKYALNSSKFTSFNGEEIEHLLSVSTNEQDSGNNLPNRSSYSSSINSGKSYSPTSESDNSSSDLEFLNESWYQPNLPRENVQSFLVNQEIGAFVIRLSNSCKNCYALSIRVPYFANQNGIAHYLITKSVNGYKLKGVEKEFKSLKSLVTHYSVMQEILPVTLNISFCVSKRCSIINQNNIVFNANISNLKSSNVSCLIK